MNINKVLLFLAIIITGQIFSADINVAVNDKNLKQLGDLLEQLEQSGKLENHWKELETALKISQDIYQKTQDPDFKPIIQLLLNYNLIVSAENDDSLSVEFYLKQGADINFIDKRGCNALMIGVVGQLIDVVNVLLDNPDIDITLKNATGKTALTLDKTDLDQINYSNQVIRSLLKHPQIDSIAADMKTTVEQLEQKYKKADNGILELFEHATILETLLDKGEDIETITLGYMHRIILERLKRFEKEYLPYLRNQDPEIQQFIAGQIISQQCFVNLPNDIVRLISDYNAIPFSKYLELKDSSNFDEFTSRNNNRRLERITIQN